MIVVATMTYALGKQIGFPEATAEFNRQLEHPTPTSLPCVRVIARLREMDTVGVHHDASATCIGKARARAFAAALAAKPDIIFVCVDDDVEADAHTLGLLLAAVRDHDDVVCVAPCLTRGSNVVNIAIDGEPVYRELPSGARTVRIVSGGFGLVAMSGRAMRHIVDAHPGLEFLDDDGVVKPALFLEMLIGRSWCGEDVSFCHRAAAAGMRLEALTEGHTVHAGALLRLRALTGLTMHEATQLR